MAIWLAPFELDLLPSVLLLLPRSRLSSAIGPDCGLLISKRPSLVTLITSPAEIQPTIASQVSRRALSWGRTASICSSINSMLAKMMSAWAISAWQRASISGSWLQSEAACRRSSRPGFSRASTALARSAAPAKWLSSVMMTNRTGRLLEIWTRGSPLSAKVGFGIVQRLD